MTRKLIDKIKLYNLFSSQRITLVFAIFSVLMTSCSRNKTVTLSGEFPEEIAAYARIAVEKNGEKWRYSLPIKEGHFEFELDSLETGIYELVIEWTTPFDERYRTLRNEEGEIVKKYMPKGYWTNILDKKIYINPNQSTQYHVKFQNNLSDKMVEDLAAGASGRGGVYWLQVVTESKDALLYDRLDSITASYKVGDYALILDSLYEASDRANKLPRDFSSLARKLNLNNNYVSYVNKKMTVVEGHLDNPVAVLSILNVDKRLMMADFDRYKGLLAGISGRAEESPLYDSLSSTIGGLPDPLEVGDEMPAPTGHMPDYAPQTFDPGEHRYSAVVFWTSWSERSRQQNEDWNDLLNRYGAKGFQVLGISLDEQIDDWRDAIRNNQLKWFHLSDIGQGFEGNNVQRYGVQSVPFAVLVDHQGRIVSTGVNPDMVATYLEENL